MNSIGQTQNSVYGANSFNSVAKQIVVNTRKTIR